MRDNRYGRDSRAALQSSQAFLNARNQDLGTLSTYQKQAGTAGIDETYAESMASYYENPAAMQVAQPNLYNYWNTHPPGGK